MLRKLIEATKASIEHGRELTELEAHIVQSHNALKLGHPKCTLYPKSRTSQSWPKLPNIGWAEGLWVQPKNGIG